MLKNSFASFSTTARCVLAHAGTTVKFIVIVCFKKQSSLTIYFVIAVIRHVQANKARCSTYLARQFS